MLLTIILATFGARYYWDQGTVSDHDMMARVAFQAFLWMLLAQVFMIFGVFAGRAALSIAEEKDRRTLDFLLATRLSNAEIVLGKLVACMTFLVAEFAVGLPIMLLLNPLGAIDLRLILLAYAGLITTGFFMIALAIWVSSTRGQCPSRRRRLGPLVDDLADRSLLRVHDLSPGGNPAAGLSLDRECMGPDQQPPRPDVQDRRRRHAFERARRCGRLDERSASRRRAAAGGLDDRSACARPIGAMSAATARAWPRGSLAPAGAGGPNRRSATIRSSGGK